MIKHTVEMSDGSTQTVSQKQFEIIGNDCFLISSKTTEYISKSDQDDYFYKDVFTSDLSWEEKLQKAGEYAMVKVNKRIEDSIEREFIWEMFRETGHIFARI